MQTRSSENWNRTNNMPNLDPLHVDLLFHSTNLFGIPDLPEVKIEFSKFPEKIIPYNLAKGEKGCVHFFIDDYRFEYIWKSPEKALTRIKRVGISLEPDFSILVGMPKAVQLFNLYRNAWLTRYFQKNEAFIIPTATWADKSSYEYCFAGLPMDSTIAIATTGVKKKDFAGFLEGFEVLLQTKKPFNLLCYGIKYKKEIEEYLKNKNIPIKFYPSYWYDKK